ncbi:hypothetical protein [Streptomyces vietnamensis]|uniref:Uncharacterized protein n=1 Tax=Streptomyces vietnamensis TaxID=362257 RepID=A0A0B5IPK7_9ACTN|nr:hypothetical protein [Streptomyces vietnamensis]AJF70354.1 hypothetical protein SVTN_39805 [Streptomyces vietnamensis]
MALPVMSPLVSERIWALPISAPSVKFLQYLVFRSENGGGLPSQRTMAVEYKVSAATVSTLLAPLFDLNFVLRRQAEERGGNRYRLHPLAAKYDSIDSMEEAFQQALEDMRAGRLPVLKAPEYQTAPPTKGRPELRIA